MIPFLFLLTLVAGYHMESNLHTIESSEDFDQFMQDKHDHLRIIVFFAPWNSNSSRYTGDFNSAAKELKDNDPPIIFAKLDTSKPANKRISDKHNAAKFPYVVYYKGNEDTFRYWTGDLTPNKIIQDAIRRQPVLREFQDLETLEKALDNEYGMTGLVLGVFTSRESNYHDIFVKTALENIEDFDWAIVYDKGEFSSYFQMTQYDGMVVIKPRYITGKKDTPFFAQYVLLSEEKIIEKIQENKFGLIALWDKNEELLNSNATPCLTLYFNFNAKKDQSNIKYVANRYRKIFEENYRFENKEDVMYNFAIANMRENRDYLQDRALTGEEFVLCLHYFGVYKDQQSQLMFNLAYDEFMDDNKILREPVLKFLTDFRLNKLSTYIKSQDEPTFEYENSVRILTGNTIEEFAVKSNLDVVLLQYEQLKLHEIADLLERYEALAKALKSNAKLLVAKIEVTENDLNEKIKRTGSYYPLIAYIPYDDRSHFEIFDKSWNLEQMQENLGKWMERERKEKPKAKINPHLAEEAAAYQEALKEKAKKKQEEKEREEKEKRERGEL